VPSIEPFPEKLRRAHTLPSGAFDGMMALICAALANTGIGCTDVVPCVIFTKHHPAWVASGNESEGRELGAGARAKPHSEDGEERSLGNRAGR
jgi:hypothetical protein